MERKKILDEKKIIDLPFPIMHRIFRYRFTLLYIPPTLSHGKCLILWISIFLGSGAALPLQVEN